MSVKLKISVTKEVLERAKYCGADGVSEIGHNCAVAVAIRDALPRAYVSEDVILVPMGKFGLTDRIPLPKSATEFILQFDRTTPEGRPLLKPISFEIDIPDEVIEKINIEELRPLLVNHPTLELINDFS